MNRRRKVLCLASIILLCTLGIFLTTRIVLAQVERTFDRNLGTLYESLFEEIHRAAESAEVTALSINEHTLVVNGMSFVVRTTSVNAQVESVHKALRSFEKECAAPPGTDEPSFFLPRPSLSSFSAQVSSVYCWQSKQSWTPKGIFEMASNLVATGDLASLGTLRAVYVRSHGTSHTFVLVQSRGPLHVARAFSPNGDVPGQDISALPRPSGRRFMSVALGGEQLLSGYQSPGRTDEVFASFKSRLEQAGFEFWEFPLSVDQKGLSKNKRMRPGGALMARINGESYLILAEDVQQSSGANSRSEGLTSVYVSKLPR